MGEVRSFIKEHVYLIPIAIIGLLIIVYLFLCMMAGSGDFYSNTTINGIKVGNMNKDEAVDALEKQYESDCKNLSLTYTIDDKEYIVSLKDNVSFNAGEGVNDIYDQLHSHFLMRGYLSLFSTKYYVPITIDDEDKLVAELNEVELLSYDTKVDTSYEVGDNEITFTKGTAGKKVDKDSVVEQAQESLSTYSFQTPIECSLVTSPLDENEMAVIYEDINGVAQNATLKVNEDYTYEIVDEKVGAKYALEDAQSGYDSAKEGQSFSIEASIVYPEIDRANLEKNLFKDVLGEYSTYVSGSSVRRNNVKLAGEFCNNVILLPDEVFSYNDTVGERTTDRGFGSAPAYSNGETVEEIGGGVCQGSSTIYNAVVLANLEIVERTNHTYISSYVPLGRDATVSWGGPDFKFKNNTDYPIKLDISYDGNLDVKILGTDLEDTSVEFTYEKLGTVARKVTEKKDDTLEEGKERVEQSGSDGAKVQTYRAVYKGGELVSKEPEAYSYYKAHERIVVVGTKKAEENEDEDEKKEEEKKEEKKQDTEDNKKTEDSNSNSGNQSSSEQNSSSGSESSGSNPSSGSENKTSGNESSNDSSKASSGDSSSEE